MSNFAVVRFDPNGSGSEDVVSTHRTEAAAERPLARLGSVRGYYLAHRKADGELKSPLEARDRRERCA